MLRVRPFTAAIGVVLSVLLSPTTRAQEVDLSQSPLMLRTEAEQRTTPPTLLTPELLTMQVQPDAESSFDDGTFVIDVVVDIDGRVVEARPTACDMRLSKEAAAARQWTRLLRFRPAMADGVPTESSTTVSLTLGAGGPAPTMTCELATQHWPRRALEGGQRFTIEDVKCSVPFDPWMASLPTPLAPGACLAVDEEVEWHERWLPAQSTTTDAVRDELRHCLQTWHPAWADCDVLLRIGTLPGERAALKAKERPDVPAKLLKRFRPKYPQHLVDEGVGGKVVVMVTVDKAGRVVRARLVSGVHPELDKLSKLAAKLHEYSPALLDGEPVVSDTPLVMRWELLGGGARPTPMRKSKRTDKRPPPAPMTVPFKRDGVR